MPEIKCAYTELKPIHKLLEHPKNPHKHSPEQIERLAKIIDYQGIRHPIIVSKRSGFIVAGHGRLSALKKLGVAEVPIDYQDFEDEASEYAFIVSDNAIGKDEWAALDIEQIKKDIQILPMNIQMLGFRDFNIHSVEMVNRGDENSEWAKDFSFDESKEEYIKLTFIFKTKDDREAYVDENKIDVKTKRSEAIWLVYL